MRIIGMISGTSFDAVEALLADIELVEESAARRAASSSATSSSTARSPTPSPSARRSAPCSRRRRRRSSEVCRLDTAIGQFFAEVAAGLIDRHGAVDCVCSHGQTVFHLVEGAARPRHAAARRAGLDRRAHRRDRRERRPQPRPRRRWARRPARQPRRRAAARRPARLGARLAQPRRDRQRHRRRAATVTRWPSTSAQPTPSWTPRSSGAREGRATPTSAASGRPRGPWTPSFSDDCSTIRTSALAPPKSTGKELFHLDYLTSRLHGRALSDVDLLATLTAASAEAIARSVRRLRPERGLRRRRRHAQPRADGRARRAPSRRRPAAPSTSSAWPSRPRRRSSSA